MLQDKKLKDIRYINILKALAIIAVVVGHSETPLVKVIYLYHMPLFFFISGYLYNDRFSINPLKQIKKRVLTLYLPFVIYQFIFLALNNTFIWLGIYSIQDKYVPGVIKTRMYTRTDYIKVAKMIFNFESNQSLLGAFWFIPVLFFTTILFSLIGFLVVKIDEKWKEKVRLVIILLLFMLGNYLTKLKIQLPKYVGNTSLVALAIFYLGYMYRRYEAAIKMSAYYAALGILLLFFNQFFGGVSMAKNAYTSPSFLMVNAVIGAYVNVYIAKRIENIKESRLSIYIKELLYYIGRNSFIIMALHFISFRLVSLAQIKIYGYPWIMLARFPVIAGGDFWWIIYSFAGVFVPILLKYITDKLIFNRKWVKK